MRENGDTWIDEHKIKKENKEEEERKDTELDAGTEVEM